MARMGEGLLERHPQLKAQVALLSTLKLNIEMSCGDLSPSGLAESLCTRQICEIFIDFDS